MSKLPTFLILLVLVGVVFFTFEYVVPGSVVAVEENQNILPSQTVLAVEPTFTTASDTPTATYTPTLTLSPTLTEVPTQTLTPTIPPELQNATDMLVDSQYFVQIVAQHLAVSPSQYGPVYPCDSLPASLPRLVLKNWTALWNSYAGRLSATLVDRYPEGPRYCMAGNVAKLEKCKYLEGLQVSEIPFNFQVQPMCEGANCDAVGLFMYKVPGGGNTNSFSNPGSTTTFAYAMQTFTNRQLYCSNTFAQYSNGIFFGTPFPNSMNGNFAIITYFPANSRIMDSLHVPYLVIQ